MPWHNLDYLNLIYSSIVIILIIELGYFNSEVASQKTWIALGTRLASAMVASVLVWKSMSRYSSFQAAEWIDIIRETSWGILLFFIILKVRDVLKKINTNDK